MSLTEFEIIAQYFQQQGSQREDVLLGIGDDCALLTPDPTQTLVVSMDTLIEGVHFPRDTAPSDIGFKTLAVNLSDLAACGAEPQWMTLALTMPEVNDEWLKGFCAGLFQLARTYKVQLVGGDITRGPLTMTLQAHGRVPPQQALRRDGASPGDSIYVSGVLGEAAMGLRLQQDPESVKGLENEARQHCLQRLNRPSPRIELGMALRGVASSVIDVSDGLAADLQHILEESGCGARVVVENLPVNAQLLTQSNADTVRTLALNGGDDFELCFTVPPAEQKKLDRVRAQSRCAITKIGEIEPMPGLRCSYQGRQLDLDSLGYRHF